MCYQVKCGTCGKSAWAGCGQHVASVYRQIAQGQHCLCRDWPGVKLPDKPAAGSDAATAPAAADAQPSTCTTIG